MRRALDKRSIKTKKAIRMAFLEKLAKKNYEDITISEIAEAANINRKTFYSHYSGIPDVLEEIEGDIIERATQVFTSLDLRDFLENPYPYLSKMTTSLNNDILFVEKLLRLKPAVGFENKIKNKILDNVIECNEGLFKDEIEARDCLEFISGGMLSAYLRWINDKESESLEELCLHITKLVVYGARTIMDEAARR